MGFVADIETDLGDYLRVLRPDGQLGGKAVLSFITGLSARCLKTDKEEVQVDVLKWFSKLEAHTKEPICHIAQILMRSFYSGDWDYMEDEYELFLHRSSQGPLTEEQFKKAIQEIRQIWIDVKLLLESVNELMRALTAANLEATWWYEPGDTETDFQALAQTLSLAAERRAERVRIKFS